MTNLLPYIICGLICNLLLSLTVSSISIIAELPPTKLDSHKECRNSSEEIGVWFYPAEFEKIDKKILRAMKERNVNSLYLSIDKTFDTKIKNFISVYKNMGLNVYTVILEDPSYVYSNNHELNESFGNVVKETNKFFDGYIIDVEPHTETGADPSLYLIRYVNMSKSIHNIASEYNVQYYDTIPIWYHEEMEKAGIEGGLNSLYSDGVYLLDYEPSVQEVLNKYIPIKDQLNKCVIINIKLTPGGGPSINASELPSAIYSIKNTEAGIGLFEANYTLSLSPDLFEIK